MATIYIGHASIDENGKISGGVAGDQTGKEVCIRTYYMNQKGWYLFRFKLEQYAEAMAEAMRQACNNPWIGYDQDERLDIMTALKKYGSLEKIAEPTECDCSSLIRACIYQATGIDVGNFTTATEPEVLAKSDLFEDKISVTSATVIRDGDILVTKKKGHTVAAVSGNPRNDKAEPSRNYLMQGDEGEEVKTMQTMLIACGYSCGKHGADSDFGSDTAKALEKFQDDYNLEVDAKYGPLSKAKLEEVYKSKTSTSKAPTYKVGKTYTLQTELKVRTGPGTNYSAKKYSQLTADGKKHDKDGDGALDKGTRVTCKDVKKAGNDIWIRTPSGWLAAFYNGKIYIK